MKHIRYLLLLPLFVLACSLTDVANYSPYGTLAAYETETAAAAVTVTETQVYERIETATPARSCTVTAAEALHLRSGPGTGYSVIGYLSPGDLLTVADERGAWMAVTTPGDLTGWVHSEYCR